MNFTAIYSTHPGGKKIRGKNRPGARLFDLVNHAWQEETQASGAGSKERKTRTAGRSLKQWPEKGTAEALDNRTLVLMSIKQPWCSSVFKPKTAISRPKDMEFRGWDVGRIGLDKSAPKFCLLLSTTCCQKHVKMGGQYRTDTSCYWETSKKAVVEAGDDALLKPLKCEADWLAAQVIIKKNGCTHGTGYPYNTIEGVVLFDGQADLEECKQHPWWPGDGYGKKGLRIVKAIRFHNPIHNVRGKVEGFPKRVVGG